MLESQRKPLSRQDMFLGRLLSECSAVGRIAVNFSTRKLRRMPVQSVLHLRVQLPTLGAYEKFSPIYDKFKYVFLVEHYQVYEEKDFIYFDLVVIL